MWDENGGSGGIVQDHQSDTPLAAESSPRRALDARQPLKPICCWERNLLIWVAFNSLMTPDGTAVTRAWPWE